MNVPDRSNSLVRYEAVLPKPNRTSPQSSPATKSSAWRIVGNTLPAACGKFCVIVCWFERFGRISISRLVPSVVSGVTRPSPTRRNRVEEMMLSTLRRALLLDRKSTRLNSSHTVISYAVFCLKKKKIKRNVALTPDEQRHRVGLDQIEVIANCALADARAKIQDITHCVEPNST